MTLGNRSYVSTEINLLWSETNLSTKRADLHHITGRFERKNVRVLELNVFPKFTLMKQVVLNVYSTQSTTSCSSFNLNKRFWFAKRFTWIVKDQQVYCTVVFFQICNFDVYTINQLEIINFLLLNIVKRLRVLTKKILSNFVGNLPIFSQL